METIQNRSRVGNITSSEIVALTSVGKRDMTPQEMEASKVVDPKSKRKTIDSGFGKAALTYIAECNMERRLGRSISEKTFSKATSWGNFVEDIAFNKLGTAYKMCSSETILHPTIDCYGGSPDCEKFDEGKTVVDIKCPFTLKSFCTFIDAGSMGAIREQHDDGEKYYWQLVSNSILTGAKYAELIIFCPFKSELEYIKRVAYNQDAEDKKTSWIHFANDSELPYLMDEGYYKNINVFRFEVPKSDKDRLLNLVLEAQKLLVPFT